jgi:hypothetical protein
MNHAPSPRDFYDSADPARWGRDEMPEQGRVTAEWLARVSSKDRHLSSDAAAALSQA